MASSVASIPTKIFTSLPSSMSATGCWKADVLRRPGTATSRCSPGCDPSGSSGASVSRRRAPTVQGSYAICRTLASRFWRSRHRTRMIAASVAKTMIWMPRTPHTRPSPDRRTVTPKSRDGMVESLRVLKACRKTAVAARRVALQMIHNTIVCAPDELRETLRRMTRMQLIRTLAAWRPDLTDYRSVVSAYRITLKSLGRRYLELHDEIADLDTMIVAIIDELAPALVARNSIGHGSTAQLLVTAGDNAERLQSEASFAALCGASPVPASSGKTTRHRLNRGGDRAANSALHIIAIGRLRTDPRIKAYIAKRVAEGHSKLEAIRCLKRYIAREVFSLISQRKREINQGRNRLTIRRASVAFNMPP